MSDHTSSVLMSLERRDSTGAAGALTRSPW